MARTDQPLSETAIANMAVTTLDERHISSLDEDTVLGRFMASQYGFARDELLRLHPWAFALKRAIIAPLGNAPAFDWRFQYQLPADCLRLLPLREEGKWNGHLIPYEREGRAILTDAGPTLKIRYIRRITAAAEFDPLFARALGERLALMAAQRVTGKNSYVDKASALYRQALADAQMVDALDRGTPEDQYRSSVVDVRLGG